MGLALFASVLEWIEQLRVQTCQTSQILGVYLVGFVFVSVDQSQLTSIGHQDLVATLLEHSACPRRVGSSLDRYAHRRLL